MPIVQHLARASIVVVALAVPAWAEPTFHETVVHDTSTVIELAVNSDTVLCSAADYSATFLKVLVPQLAQLTLLDHQNPGAGAPCVAAGPCEPGQMPEDVLDPAHPTERVTVKVKAVRIDTVDAAAQTCVTALTERVDVTIRGIAFGHERWADLGSRPIADCGAAANVVRPPYETSPTEGQVQAEDEVEADVDTTTAAGCSAGAGGGGLGLVLVLAGGLGRRRRRA